MVGRKRGFRKSSIRCWQTAVTADFSAVEKPVDLISALGSGCYGAARHGLSPIPRQKLTQPESSMVVDARQYVGEPGLRIDIVEPGGLDQCQHNCGALAATIRPREQPRLAAKGNSAQRALGCVVAQADAAIREEPREHVDTLDQRRDIFAARGYARFGRAAVDQALQREDGIELLHRLESDRRDRGRLSLARLRC